MPMRSKSRNILSFRLHVKSKGGTFFETPGIIEVHDRKPRNVAYTRTRKSLLMVRLLLKYLIGNQGMLPISALVKICLFC